MTKLIELEMKKKQKEQVIHKLQQELNELIKQIDDYKEEIINE